jgi:hypothetical protein
MENIFSLINKECDEFYKHRDVSKKRCLNPSAKQKGRVENIDIPAS